jgi:branched-chain amino acid transport system permease protein
MQVRTLEIFDWSATGSANWYWISAAVLLIGVVLAQNLRSSRSGLALRGLKESESAASAAGVDIAHYKLLAFIVAAIYAAVAGSMLALMNAFVSPDQASFLHSVELLTMVVIGGLGSVVGSVVGAALLVILPQVLSVFQDYEHVVLGLIIILSITFLPSGIVPSLIARFEASKHR